MEKKINEDKLAVSRRLDFFETLFEYCDLGGDSGTIELRGIKDGVKLQKWFDSGEKLSEYLEKMDVQPINLYFGLCPRRRNGGKKEDVLEVPFLWADIDFKDLSSDINSAKHIAIKSIKEFPLKPTFIVSSGGGLHIYWKLSEPVFRSEFAKVESYLRRLAYKLNGDMNCAEVARVLRVPYTPNFKYTNTFVKIVKKLGFEYDLDDFDQFLPPESGIHQITSTTILENQWWTNGFMEKAYSKTYEAGNRNDIVVEVIKYYANQHQDPADVFFHVKKFVDECVWKGDGNYGDKDIKRRVQWGIDNRQMYDCIRVDKETDKAVLALMWIPKSRINSQQKGVNFM